MKDTWRVDSRVIYPPVSVDSIQAKGSWKDFLSAEESEAYELLPDAFVLGASRFVPYKRLVDVIRTGELLGLPVVLAGGGPSYSDLAERAKTSNVPVIFIDDPSDRLLYALYQAATLYVFPAVEDFGIMPVEAMAAGAPVLAQSVGGTAETVREGMTGALTNFERDDEILSAVQVALSTKREDRLAHARRFTEGTFKDSVASWVAAS